MNWAKFRLICSIHMGLMYRGVSDTGGYAVSVKRRCFPPVVGEGDESHSVLVGLVERHNTQKKNRTILSHCYWEDTVLCVSDNEGRGIWSGRKLFVVRFFHFPQAP